MLWMFFVAVVVVVVFQTMSTYMVHGIVSGIPALTSLVELLPQPYRAVLATNLVYYSCLCSHGDGSLTWTRRFLRVD